MRREIVFNPLPPLTFSQGPSVGAKVEFWGWRALFAETDPVTNLLLSSSLLINYLRSEKSLFSAHSEQCSDSVQWRCPGGLVPILKNKC